MLGVFFENPYHYTMRKSIIIVVLAVICSVGWGQNLEVELLIKKGISLHEKGFYEDAIKKYQAALEIEPLNVLAHYELSYSYMESGKWEEALYHSKQVIRENKDYWLEAVMVNGAALDNLGESKKAIKLYLKALKRKPNNYLLNYNLGISLFSEEDYVSAERAVQKAILNNRKHTSSHLLLANIKMQQGQRLKSALSLYFFLLYEQDSDRSVEAWDQLQVIWLSAAIKNKGAIAIKTNPKALSSGMGGGEIAMGAIASNFMMDEEAKTIKEPHKFVDKTQKLFSILNETKNDDLGFWEIVYLDHFNALSDQGHIESFAYFISNCKYKPEVLTWITENGYKFQEFMNWMELQP